MRLKQRTPVFRDVSDLIEDDRIRLIGQYATDHPDKTASFLTDDEPGKMDRYIRKLTTWYPLVEVAEREPGSGPGVVYGKVRKKAH